MIIRIEKGVKGHYTGDCTLIILLKIPIKNVNTFSYENIHDSIALLIFLLVDIFSYKTYSLWLAFGKEKSKLFDGIYFKKDFSEKIRN